MQRYPTYRWAFFKLGFGLIVVALICRLFYLQIIKYDYFHQKALSQLMREITISPNRGYIYDRNKNILALTTFSYSIFASPHFIKDKSNFARMVSKDLDVPFNTIYNKINNDLYFVWIARKRPKEVYLNLKAHKLEGLDFIKEEKRIYPNKKMASQVLGFVGIDNQGLSGLEFQYNEFLTGLEGKIVLEIDPRGRRLITGKNKIIDQTYDGWHLYTTLDTYIQHISEKYLKEGVTSQQAIKGNVIVMNPKTGEILAMANYPEFNPNKWFESSADNRRNRCVTDLYEPGSVFKILTMSSVLDKNFVQPDTYLNIPTSLKINTRTIREAHERPAGMNSNMKVEQILIESLNVGTSILALKAGKENFFQYLNKFGVLEKTKIEIPGEAPTMLKPFDKITDLDLAMMSFGQGIAVTPIQIISIASVIANGGELIKPRIINYLADNNEMNITAVGNTIKRQVISKQTAAKVRDMMIKVVDEGTAANGQIKGFTIAGKTGTAQVPNGTSGYFPDRYVASFVGFLPAYDPKIVILVVVDSPKKSIWGSTVAVPIFDNIAQDLIDYLNISPDRKPSENTRTMTVKFHRAEP